MDIVTDLTSQAVSYLTLLQDICKDQDIPYEANFRRSYAVNVREQLPAIQARYLDICKKEKTEDDESEASREMIKKRIKRAKEIVFYSNSDKKDSDTLLVTSFFETGGELLSWLDDTIENGTKAIENSDEVPLLMTPDEWRRSFRVILYESPEQRLTLAKILNYIPLQVILALEGAKEEPYSQRVFQVFYYQEKNPLLDEKDNKLLKDWWDGDFELDEKWWQDKYSVRARSGFIETLITNDKELLKWVEKDNPVSFETAFSKELEHIDRSRKERRKDPSGFVQKTISLYKSEGPGEKGSFTLMDDEDAGIPESGTKDPLVLAEEMKLTGLAFSGGGIRSATFNLGVIQKLAENGILQHIDYLSTVSGGGYIGSWLLSWIKRSGSISKVTDRLDSKKSTDPMADEVRPLRWLRMYSNYLAPNASIMSTDSWTIGVTWIRNTLINQSILLLLICMLLAFVENIYLTWKYLAETNFNTWTLPVFSTLILASGSLLAALGMNTFDKDVSPKSLLRYGRDQRYASILAGWAFLTAFLVSAWFYKITSDEQTFPHKLKVFIAPAIVGFLGILLIAYLGNYQKQKRIDKNWKAHLSIVGSSLIAIVAAFLLLAGVWKIFESIHLGDMPGNYESGSPSLSMRKAGEFADTRILAFVIGIPLILEVISICVVTRMFIMGIYFPDERREWWGRMGAIVHRFILLWLITTVCVFILPKAVKLINEQDLKSLVALLGGWAAIVGAGVRMAFTSTSSGENKDKSGFSFKEVFIRAAPYLFMVGFVLIGSYTLDFFKRLDVWSIICEILNRIIRDTSANGVLNAAIAGIEGLPQAELLGGLLNMSVVGALTLFLSWRAGVNEFTLHHFYRNRLIRAYLGATRRRTDRIKTANNFTGFDNADDIKMQDFSVENNYYGPYPLINTALNATIVSELDRQDRKAESFLFTPLFCGFDFSATRSAAYSKDGIYNYGYRPTKNFAGGPTLGTAMAISGAAVNPNMGYHSSSATAFLLSVFNVKLGWWIGNPRTDCWKNPEPKLGIGYITYDLIGSSTINSNYVSLSDGGHFDNMGIYELVRRRCSLIILGDAEEDSGSLCEGLANAVRRCRIDFGVEIDINTDAITNKDDKTLLGKAHVVEGTITYPGKAKPGKLIYIKTALTGDEPADIREYKMQNPKFPQQPTSDQFFTEDQFESYRKLGYHSIL